MFRDAFFGCLLFDDTPKKPFKSVCVYRPEVFGKFDLCATTHLPTTVTALTIIVGIRTKNM